jgi:hypothetical protein
MLVPFLSNYQLFIKPILRKIILSGAHFGAFFQHISSHIDSKQSSQRLSDFSFAEQKNLKEIK